MVLYNKNLYEKIISNECLNAHKLNVITGYCSAKFLKKVKADFPSLKIRIFIGMYTDGISRNEHESFKELMRDYSDIKVYYQVKSTATHIKLLEFVNDFENSIYMGSANFTTNGFETQNELMVKISDDVDYLFYQQKEHSKLCSDLDIERYINIYEDIESIESNVPDATQEHLETNSRVIIKSSDKNQFSRKINSFNNMIDVDFYGTFSYEIVLDEQGNPRWDTTGINSIFIDKIPTILDNNTTPFYKVFPKNEDIFIYSDDERQYKAKLMGINKRELGLIDGNLYEYVKNRIKLKEYRPIHRDDLYEAGVTRVSFERLNKNNYYMKL